MTGFALPCVGIWLARDGARTAIQLTGIGLAAFALSHVLALGIGAWPAVLTAAAGTAAACWRLSDARARLAPAGTGASRRGRRLTTFPRRRVRRICSRTMHSGAASEGTTGATPRLDAGRSGLHVEDLVLPEAQEATLQSASATLESGGRLRLLFRGGPGTGKTMACQILGARCDAPVLSLDAEREGHPRRSCDRGAAARGRSRGCGRRRRSRRPAPPGTPGVAPLQRAPGRRRDAGARPGAWRRGRVHVNLHAQRQRTSCSSSSTAVVDFPFPDRHVRRAIWRRLLPGDSRLTEADLEHVAGAFRLPGARSASAARSPYWPPRRRRRP